MHTSKNVYSFELSHKEGHIIITAQQWPWSVLQVVPATPDTFDAVVAKCGECGFVAKHDTDRTFCIIHLCSGDQGGLYPEKHIEVYSQEDARKYLDSLKDCMAQAAVWYHANISKAQDDAFL